MELSPLAKERLAKAGELSAAEKEKAKLNEELTAILSDFFTAKLDSDGLQQRMKKFKEQGKDFMINETQLRLAHTLSMGGNDADFDRYSSGILALEKLKGYSKYIISEKNLDNIKKLRRQYQQERTTAFSSMKDSIGGQVRMAAQQMARQKKNQNVSVDIESSIEASVRNSPQWRQFVLKHEKDYDKKLEEALAKLTSEF